jgi:hypothetical protein
MIKKWSPPKHGDKSKYIHVRLKPPSMFTKKKFRTIDIGNGLKQVYGNVKDTKKWKAQNIMIPRSKVIQRGERLTSKSVRLKNILKEHGINISKVKHMKTGGSADYALSGR